MLIADKPFIALYSDAFIVKKECANGHPVFYGDVRNPELLKATGASNVQVIIVSLDDRMALITVGVNEREREAFLGTSYEHIMPR